MMISPQLISGTCWEPIPTPRTKYGMEHDGDSLDLTPTRDLISHEAGSCMFRPFTKQPLSIPNGIVILDNSTGNILISSCKAEWSDWAG